MLNASRHHGKGDFLRLLRSSAEPRGAQRLSASRQGGPVGSRCAPVSRGQCSTPLGITARGTSANDASLDEICSCSTPLGITARGTGRGGASAHRTHRCSTPLGITARGTENAHEWPRSRNQVLNASRHHGKGDSAHGAAPRGAGGVLNASRHHGKGDRIKFWYSKWQILKCSTPLGITARGTSLREALRSVSSLCSTPLGITARGTHGEVDAIEERNGAQRLSASRQGGLATPTTPGRPGT